MLARSLMGGSLELRIPPATPAATRNHHAIIGRRKVMHPLAGVGVVNNGPHRHLEDHVLAFAPGFIRTLAMAPALRFIFGVKAEMHERIMALARFHNHVA